MPPPQIYDILIDAYRDITQAEVDQLISISQAYGELRVQVLAAVHRAHIMVTTVNFSLFAK